MENNLERIIRWLQKHRRFSRDGCKVASVFKMLYQDGIKQYEVAEVLGKSRQRIGQLKRKALKALSINCGLGCEQIERNLMMFRDFEHAHKIRKLSSSGLNKGEIAERIGESGKRVRYVCDRYKIKIVRPYDLVDSDLFLRIVTMGKISCWEIAYLLGFSVRKKKTGHACGKGLKIVYRKLKEYNIKIKKRGNGEKLAEWIRSHPQERCRARDMRPNKLEKFFDEITPFYVQYTGDGKNFVQFSDGRFRNPDFIIENKPKCIELHGDYYHRKENAQKLIDAYAEVGWECLIIWENYIIDFPKETIQAVHDFVWNIAKLGEVREIGRNFYKQFHLRGKPFGSVIHGN